MDFSYDYYKKASDFILSKTNVKPELAIILGTGLGGLALEIENPVEISYKDIPNFLVSTVNTHAGKLIIGKLAGKNVVCMSGRFHYYEGYGFDQLALSVRVFKLLGVKKIILTNAAGAVNTGYRPGDVMLIKDHINLMGASPTRGKNIDEFGPRFFDVSNMYSKEMRSIAKSCASSTTLRIQEGVYYFFCGPQFETPAEIKAVRMLGADAVGMSTVWEALTAAHCGIPVLAMSLITNMAAGVLEQSLDGAEVEVVADKAGEELRKFVKAIVEKI